MEKLLVEIGAADILRSDADPASVSAAPAVPGAKAFLAYGRVLDFWGKSAKLNVIVPYTELTGTAEFRGQTVERDVTGFADPMFKLSVNLYGAPALTLKEFAGYEQDLIVGASLRVTAPMGRYDNTKVVNLGTNRWSFKPEVASPRRWAVGRWRPLRRPPCSRTTRTSSMATPARRTRSIRWRGM